MPDITAIVKHAERQLGQAGKVLDRRYRECDYQGHQKPDKTNNYCNHCYRHLEYTSKSVKDILESRKNFSTTQQPLDASRLKDISDNDIDMQKGMDTWEGLFRLMKGLLSS